MRDTPIHLTRRAWPHIAALAFALVYFALQIWLAFREHAAFQTPALDLGTYDQMLWNTARGRFFEGTLQEGPGRMAAHFSPILIALVPFYVLWPNVHLLFVANALGLVTSGLVLYRWAHEQAGVGLALAALAAYYLSPALFIARHAGHFRDIMLALPFAALAVYGLATRRRTWLLAGSCLLLLAKEDMGLYVATFSLYWLWRTREWRWGLGLTFLGIAWSAVGTLVIVPYVLGWGDYPQSGYYQYLEGVDWHNPASLAGVGLAMLSTLLTVDRIPGLIRLLAPTGLLFLLSPLSATLLPPMMYLLSSTQHNVYQLRAWHPVVPIPILYFAAVEGLLRLHGRRRTLATVYLLLASLAGYWLFSPGPFSSEFEAARFEVEERDRQVARHLATLPAQAAVTAQQAYGPHLSEREWIRIFPDDVDQAQFIIVDRRSNPWPLRRPRALNHRIDQLLADPRLAIQADHDGFFIFRRTERIELRHPLQVLLGNRVELMGFDLASAGADVSFEELAEGAHLRPGDRLRLALYWRARVNPERNYSVAVRVMSPYGREMLRRDAWPVDGWLPTTAWQPGQEIRDLHELKLESSSPAGPAILRVALFDPESGRNLPAPDGREWLDLTRLELVHP